jgi:hypothetical protein
MTDLTPTPNQLQSWIDKICYPHEEGVGPSLKDKELACLAFKAGADQELKACCVLMDEWGLDGEDLVECRRPKPPTLKEQALDELTSAERLYPADWSTIRRALEALPND